jgi:hypothetical protein
MPAADDALVIPFDPPDADVVWEHYLETCRRAGIEPVSRERADGLMQEWPETIAAALTTPTTH